MSNENELEKRLQAVEDQLAIYQVICGYGYAVDGCNAEAVGSLYAEDGVYAIGDTKLHEGREGVAAITSGKIHMSYVNAGCGHVTSLPYVVIDGDRATATCHMTLVSRREDDFYVARLSASRIELARKSNGGWEITYRRNFLLDGAPEGRDLLSRVMEGPSGAAA